MNETQEEFKISDYGIFSDAVSTVSQVNESLTNAVTTLNECRTKTDDDSIFMGPVSDSCVDGFGKIDTKIESETTNFGKIQEYLISTATNYKNGDTAAMNTILNLNGENSTLSGGVVTNGNVIDTTNPVGTGEKYNLSDDDIAYLAYVAMREQGSVEGAKLELSLMANLYEQHKNSYSDVKDYVQNSGWFASSSRTGYSYPGDSYYAAAQEVLNDGVRYLPSNVNEHDYMGDIANISTGDKSDRSDYVPGETVIHNNMGSTYVFVGFAPNGGDPFGYIA